MSIAILAISVKRADTCSAQEPSSPPPNTQAVIAHETPGLIPAAFGVRTDREGNSWSVERDGNIGRIGTTMVNSGLALSVNDEKFAGFQPMMTADGAEFVFQGAPFAQLPGLQAQRRVRVLDRSGGLRYAELFYNGSTNPMEFSIGLMTHFSGNYQTFLSDRGRSEPFILGQSESGIIVMPGASQSTRAFLFTLADPGAGVKPTISSQNRYGLTFRYQIRLAPGETAVIVHHVTQVVIPQSFDRPALVSLTRPHALRSLRYTFDDDWTDAVVNCSAESAGSAREALLKGGPSSLGLVPGAIDTLAIGDVTRLFGRAEGGPVHLKGRYGEIRIALENVAAISGEGNSSRREARVFLKDGQVFAGAMTAPDLSFVQTGGARLSLDPATLDRLVLADRGEGRDWTTDSLALVETYGGDRIKIRDLAAFTLNLATSWGALPVSLDTLDWLRQVEGQMGCRVKLKDGTTVIGFPEDEEISIGETDLGSISINRRELMSIFTPHSSSFSPSASPAPIETVTRVMGGQELVGSLLDTNLPVITEGNRLEMNTSEIRKIRRLEATTGELPVIAAESPTFAFERWDGGKVTGYLGLDFLSIEVEGRNWLVPSREVAEIEAASPLLTPDSLEKIKALIVQLADDDWAAREEATRDLGAFGYLARPVLQRELGTTKDPEVARRIGKVLADLN